MERPIRGPDTDRPHLDSREAGRWLGDIGAESFEKLMGEHLPTVRPLWMAGAKFWRWEDVAVLAYVLSVARPSQSTKGKKGDTESTEPGK